MTRSKSKSKSKSKSNAARIGTALGVVSASTVAMTAGTALSPAAASTPRCIDAIEDIPVVESEAWDLTAWEDFIGGCDADFGNGKLIVDVITEDGTLVADTDIDIDRIVDAFDFGYIEPTQDSQRTRFDSYCNLTYEDQGQFLVEFFATGIHDYLDFRLDEDVAGREKFILQLLGDRDNPLGAGMQEYLIQNNELMFTWWCNGDFDHLRMLAVADVGGGYQLKPGDNITFSGFNPDGEVTRVQVEVSLTPVETTTTTTTTMMETTTTVMDSTTTVAATTTTAVAIIPPAPPAPTAPAAILPETGRSSSGTAVLAGFLLAIGAACVAATRRRRPI